MAPTPLRLPTALIFGIALGTPAFAQSDAGTPATIADAGVPAAIADAGTREPTAEPTTSNRVNTEALRMSIDARLDAANREIRELKDQMKLLMANQSQATTGWQADWIANKRKLEFVTFDGYLRVRPDLFYNFNLWGRSSAGTPYTDPSGYTLWPVSTTSNSERTNEGINMRFRVEPTLNISEEVRIRAQFDILDNITWGSTPSYSYSRNASNGYAYDRNQFGLFSTSQNTPSSGINSVSDAIAVKLVWAEVATPIGLLRFGRMPAQWGMGILYNDGNDIDSDYGDNFDRVSFTVEPVHGWFIVPMYQINIGGTSSLTQQFGGQSFNLSSTDASRSYLIAIARKDTEAERAQKLAAGGTVFNFGLHFEYRAQSNDSVNYYNPSSYGTQGLSPTQASATWVPRRGQLFIPDLWAKVEGRRWKVEAEVAAILGSITNRALTPAGASDPGQDQSLYVYEVGGAINGEYRFLNGDLEVGAEIGVASGDKSPGFGVYNRRVGKGSNGQAQPGDIDGPQYTCSTIGTCANNQITNYTFNPAYRVDMILYREILGSVTDSIYVKPRIKYRIVRGFEAWFSLLYSRAMFVESTPSYIYGNNDASLGVELNVGARYETDDGFFGQIQYGVLFPLAGFSRTVGNPGTTSSQVPLEVAHAVRAILGVKF